MIFASMRHGNISGSKQACQHKRASQSLKNIHLRIGFILNAPWIFMRSLQ